MVVSTSALITKMCWSVVSRPFHRHVTNPETSSHVPCLYDGPWIGFPLQNNVVFNPETGVIFLFPGYCWFRWMDLYNLCFVRKNTIQDRLSFTGIHCKTWRQRPQPRPKPFVRPHTGPPPCSAQQTTPDPCPGSPNPKSPNSS